MNNSKNVRVFKLLSLLIPSFMFCGMSPFPASQGIPSIQAPDLPNLPNISSSWQEMKKEPIFQVLLNCNLKDPLSALQTSDRLAGENGGPFTMLCVMAAAGGLFNLIQVSLYWLYGPYCWLAGRENLLLPKNIYSFDDSKSLKYYVEMVQSANDWYNQCMGSPLMPFYLAWYYATGIAIFTVGLFTFALTLAAFSFGAAKLNIDQEHIKKALGDLNKFESRSFLNSYYDWYIANKNQVAIKTFIQGAVGCTSRLGDRYTDLKSLLASNNPEFYLHVNQEYASEVKFRFGIDLSQLRRVVYLNTLTDVSPPNLESIWKTGNKFGFSIEAFQAILENVKIDSNTTENFEGYPGTNYASCFWIDEQEENNGKAIGAKKAVDKIIPNKGDTFYLNSAVKELIDAVFKKDIKKNGTLAKSVEDAWSELNQDGKPEVDKKIKYFYNIVVSKMLYKLSEVGAEAEGDEE